MLQKICDGCPWNRYPICEGTKMEDGRFMNIENLKPLFECGQKDIAVMSDFTIKKTELELLKERVEVLENAKRETN